MKYAIPLALLLAGCAAPVAPETAACERQANADPEVRELIMKGAGNPHFQLDNQPQLAEARQRATRTCLRARGLAPRGGVEQQKP